MEAMKHLTVRRRPAPEKLEHQRLTSLINSMADGVIAVDRQLKIELYNGAALNVLDLNSLTRGKALQSAFKPLDKQLQPIDISEYMHAIKTPKVNRELQLKYSDGSVINLYLSITPVRQGFGRREQDGFVLLLRDITREKSLEEERDEFISVASHELRTPIAIAEGNVSNAQYIAEHSANMTEIKKALQSAHQQILFLAAIMNDLATLSRAERGKLSVEVETIDVSALISALIDDYKPRAAEQHLKLTADVAAQAHLKPLHSSTLYVREILQNFITNALKYTYKGSVTISAAAKGNGILFAVVDTGIGISRNDQARLFEKFFRSEDYRTRSTGGTGLGLYVSKKLAQLLDAEITVESQLNHGSTFSIFVPDLATKDK
jgi:PAS domain S-box-containing protein